MLNYQRVTIPWNLRSSSIGAAVSLAADSAAASEVAAGAGPGGAGAGAAWWSLEGPPRSAS